METIYDESDNQWLLLHAHKLSDSLLKLHLHNGGFTDLTPRPCAATQSYHQPESRTDECCILFMHTYTHARTTIRAINTLYARIDAIRSRPIAEFISKERRLECIVTGFSVKQTLLRRQN